MKRMLWTCLLVTMALTLVPKCTAKEKKHTTRQEVAEWAAATQNPTCQSLILFIRRFPTSDHLRDALELLKPFGSHASQLTISDVFPRSNDPQDMIQTETDVKIQNVYNKNEQPVSVFLDGRFEFLPNGKKMTWNPGAVHTIVSGLTINGYLFFSTDQQHPLVFHVVLLDEHRRGYKYWGGTGMVIDPANKVYMLNL